MIFRVCYIILFVALLASCSTGPDFERDNIKDPKSIKFAPNSPDTLTSNIYVNDKKEVVLSWLDVGYEDGYILKKRIRNDDEFLEIARLDSNTTSYIDSSMMLSTTTMYKLTSYSVRNDSINLSSKPLEFSLDFDPIKELDFYASADNIGTLYWSFSNRDSIGTRYFDAFLVELNRSSINENWETLDTLGRDQFKSDNIVSFSLPTDLFDLRLRISQIPILNDSENSAIKIKTFQRDFKYPTSVYATFINETDFALRWKSPLTKYDMAIIKNYDTVIDTIYTQKLFHTITHIGNNNTYRRFKVQLVKGENYSKTVDFGEVPVFIGRPSIEGVTSKSDFELDLFWARYSSEQTEKRFFIERKNEFKNSFSLIDSVDATQLKYSDQNLDKNYDYTYRVRSVLSDPSIERKIGFRKTLELNNISEFDIPGGIPRFSNSGKLEARFDQDDLVLYIFNKELSNYSSIKFETSIPNYVRSRFLVDYELGKRDSLVAYIGTENYVEGRYYLELYNHENNKVLYKLSGGLATHLYSLTFSEDNKNLLFMSSTSGTLNSQKLNILNLESLQLLSYSVGNGFNSYVLLNDNKTTILCSGNGIYSFDIEANIENILSNISCFNMFRDEYNKVLYFYSPTNGEVYSFNEITNTTNLIAKIPTGVQVNPYSFKHFPDLDIILYHSARLDDKNSVFVKSLIQDLAMDKYSFITHQKISQRRGALPLHITYDNFNSEIIIYTYDGIYNYSPNQGWAILD
ncbi:MAG: hypothetical protein WC967_09565 [Balneolaceae bacterium]